MFPPTSQKHAGMQLGQMKLSLSVNQCINGALQWIGILPNLCLVL